MDLPETDSLDNSALVPPVMLPEAASMAVPAPRPIRIVRDGILAFVCSSAVTLVSFLVVIVVAVIAGVMKVTPGESAPSLSPGLVVAVLLATEIPFAATGAFLRWRYRKTGRLLLNLFEETRFSSILLGIGAGLLLMGFGILQASLVERFLHRSPNPAMEELMRSIINSQGSPGILVTLVLLIAVATPFCEELFFRGALFSSVRSTDRARAGAVISSVLFAVAHVSLLMSTYYLVFGFTMCWLLSRTRTMAAPIAAHITVNSIGCIAILMAKP